MARVSVKEKVLSILNAHKGQFYSGQDLAEELGVSRTAVWKAINTLREQGFAIEGSTNLGYALAEETDILDAMAIYSYLSDEAKAFYRLECFETIDSTNNEARKHAINGEEEGYCAIAEQQTAGRGRRGRSFYSPENTGLYLSVLLRPELSFEEAVLITTIAAVAGAKACESVNPDATIQIKWVNDIFRKGKKFCGILTEAELSMETGKPDFAIIGIGFNLSAPESGWPEEIADIVTGLFDDKAPNGSRNRLAAAFLNEFLPIYQKLPEVTYLDEYRKHLLGVGKKIQVLGKNGESRPATLIGVNEKCELIVLFENEINHTTLNSGEISIIL